MLNLFVAVMGLTPAAEVPPSFAATRASDGIPIFGTLTRISPGFAVTFAGQTPAIAEGDLVALVRQNKPRPHFPTGPQVILANGDRISGTIAGGNGQSLTLKTTFGNGQSVPLPLSALSVVWFHSPPADILPDVDRYPWNEAGKRQDVLLLRNGDAVRGRLENLAEDGATIRFKPENEKASKSYETKAITAMALDPTLARVRPPKGPYARVITIDGSRVSLTTLLADEALFTGSTLTGAKLSITASELIAVEIRNGKSIDLNELKPKSVLEEGYSGVVWPWKPNRSVRGRNLHLLTERGEEVFDSGLGVHSRSSITYSLNGKYRRFEALVGLDASTGRKGAVEVRVLLDGVEVKLDGLKNLTVAGTKSIRVDVSKAKELTLIVDYGEGGDVQDDLNWANARLIE